MPVPGTGEAGPPAPGSSDAVALFADRARANGDAHLSNFGAFASPERRLVFDVKGLRC